MLFLSNNVRGDYIDYTRVPPVISARRWTLAELNFDHVGIALLTLFTVQTRDNWPGYVESCSYRALSSDKNIMLQLILM